MKKNLNINMKNKKSTAIIGGMGPQASARLLTLMVEICTRDFGIKIDSDFPEIILDSVPVPNFISNEKNSIKAFEILKSRVKKMEIFEPSCFAISCNTAHILLPQMQSLTKVPFVSIIEEVTKEAVKRHMDSIGLLASPTTINSGLYQNALAKQNINVIIPTQKEISVLDQIIRRVLAGEATNKDVQILKIIATSLGKMGARGIILGCTELPLIFPKDFPLSIFDSIEILSRSLLHKSLRGGDKYD